MKNQNTTDYHYLQLRLGTIFSLCLLVVIVLYSSLLLASHQLFWHNFERKITEHFPLPKNHSPAWGEGRDFYPSHTCFSSDSLMVNGWRLDVLANNQLPVSQVVQVNSVEFSRSSRRALIFFDFLLWSLGSVGGYFFIGYLLLPVKKAAMSQRDFVANASHELKTPITTIKTELMLCRGQHLSRSLRESLQVIEQENNFLANTVNKLLLATTSSRVVASEFALDRLIALLATTMQKNYQAKKLVFESQLPANLQMISDPLKLKEILVLLLDNAGKYSLPGSKVIIQAQVSKKMVLIKVINQGLGIKPLDRELIFQRFYRVADPKVSSCVGSGLGLAIARDLATTLAGKLYLSDGSPGHTCFCLQLKRFYQ